ncbi:hypothetical protein PCAR4_300016 [Paraburkholderia caribensis]|nr:hypothetical protein PCAR4_300016 [Paraburkholderia caribensis]
MSVSDSIRHPVPWPPLSRTSVVQLGDATTCSSTAWYEEETELRAGVHVPDKQRDPAIDALFKILQGGRFFSDLRRQFPCRKTFRSS